MTSQGVTRRGVLVGGAAAVGAVGLGTLAACDDGEAGSGAWVPVTVPVEQVPVGGAAIVSRAVLSQPVEGEFVAFSAVCTHEGCLVSRVRAQTVECTCHGSIFSAVDGAALQGPASGPLDQRTVTVEGDTLTVT